MMKKCTLTLLCLACLATLGACSEGDQEYILIDDNEALSAPLPSTDFKGVWMCDGYGLYSGNGQTPQPTTPQPTAASLTADQLTFGSLPLGELIEQGFIDADGVATVKTTAPCAFPVTGKGFSQYTAIFVVESPEAPFAITIGSQPHTLGLRLASSAEAAYDHYLGTLKVVLPVTAIDIDGQPWEDLSKTPLMLTFDAER